MHDPIGSSTHRGKWSAFVALDPSNDLVVVCRWSLDSAQGFRKVVESIVK
jgi:hypothetical protein